MTPFCKLIYVTTLVPAQLLPGQHAMQLCQFVCICILVRLHLSKSRTRHKTTMINHGCVIAKSNTQTQVGI